MSVWLFEGDNRVSLQELIDAGVQVHSVVTDPPYGITFMGKEWDGTMIERDPKFWKLVLDVLLPGGYCIAFSGSRTGHWQAVAMEQAGFIMHPMIGWVTGQGFPKAYNASKAIDRELGVEREVVAQVRVKGGGTEHINRKNAEAHGYRPDSYQKGENILDVTISGSPEAQQWEGWAYGTQSLKPAMEPIYVGQKPFSEKNGALNILKHGVGAINIDGCRVPINPEADASQLRTMNRSQREDDNNGQSWGMSKNQGDTPVVVRPEGRHPANLLHDDSDEVIACFPDAKGQQGALKGHSSDRVSPNGTFGTFPPARDCEPRNDEGSAARFFNALPITELDTPIHYCPKANKADRAGSKHPTVKPIALMRWLCRLVTPPGGTVLDPFGGSGTTAAAALLEGFNPVLMEREPEYLNDIKRRFGMNGGLIDD